MALTNRFLMGCASLSMVFAIGFVMQNGADTPPAPVVRSYDQAQRLIAPPVSTDTLAEASAEAMAVSRDRIALSDIALTVGTASDAADDAVDALALPADDERLASIAPIDPMNDLAPLEVAERACDPVMELSAQPGAMVLVSIDAPCLPGARVTLHHNGLMFTHLTDAAGQLVVSAPALSESAVFIADLGNGDGAVGHVMVPDMVQYERAAAQWRGDLGISLHAYEFGATYGEEGHVWAGALSTSAVDAQMVLLGDRDLPESYRAEVYTVPATAAMAGQVQLSIEAEVTVANCDRDIQAEAIQWRAGGQLEVRELSLAVPGCDTVGDFLLLKNLLQDLKLAAR
ncbi:hypothetical protein [Thalassovita mediterranea]|jgi:hypothetical protein|uniref:Translocase n=1 Tax=Thalassovita mediterranea TaxID=340021 RepID=A0A0P1GPM5_9RHOB|nr:hypothetical protein [Thalassovita mediterranea]CUH84304.1 hypothetical protein TM5383_01512 [Thalassovita mediterranea]SIS31828.1 hypothetical protein SAMN05421685_105108 [Thalassovita mediterranea]